MTLEAILSFLHITAFLSWMVFATSATVHCSHVKDSGFAVQRLIRLDRALWLATLAVLLTGLARIYWGVKGEAFYAGNWLLYLKVFLFLAIVAMQIGPSRSYRAWQRHFDSGQHLPPEPQVRMVRRRMMLATHLMAVIPLPAVFLARGFGSF